MPSGYSGKPLFEKLGVKPGEPVLLAHAPPDYFQHLGLPKTKVTLAKSFTPKVKIVHAFCESEIDLRIAIEKFPVESGQTLWVSWKKGKVTEVTEDLVRKHAYAAGLVDLKVCSVSEIWSGLKLNRRKAK